MYTIDVQKLEEEPWGGGQGIKGEGSWDEFWNWRGRSTETSRWNQILQVHSSMPCLSRPAKGGKEADLPVP